MEVLRFFTAMLQILYILRISTGEGFRKEKPVHDVCMGWILEGIKHLNSVETDLL